MGKKKVTLRKVQFLEMLLTSFTETGSETPGEFYSGEGNLKELYA